MLLFGTDIALTPGWSTEDGGEGFGHAHYEVPEGTIELSYYELLPGILLTSIDLSCSELPALFPLGPHLATINWCAAGRCEVDFGDQGSLVVSKGTICVSSALAKTFAYPTGTYRGFEIFVDLDHVDDEGWALLSRFGLTRRRMAEGLCPPNLGVTLLPSGQLAHATAALEAELSSEQPRLAWLLLRASELLMLLVDVDPSASVTAGAYLQRSQRDMAQAVYQHIIEDDAPFVGLASLAQRFGVSEASLRAYFARVYGESPASFARSRALARAAHQLVHTDASIADVAFACGYANPSKFSAAFRRIYEASPLEYRRRSRLS